MFLKQFNVIEDNLNHIQCAHIKIEENDFNKLIIKSLFDDNNLYKYVTNYSSDRMEEIGLKYPVKQLIHLIKNLKKEYIQDCVSKDVKKKICKSLKAKYNGSIINVRDVDWETKFDKYLEDNITGYDVVAEIILSKIIEEKFGADVFITKLAQTTNSNMKVFGIDTVHYNLNENTMFFGESKLTNNIDLGIGHHIAEISLMDYKMNEECKMISLHENDIRCKEKVVHNITKFGRNLTIYESLSILNIKKEDKYFNIAIVYFIAHGENYDYNFITDKIEKFRKKIKFKDIKIYCVTLPIKDKNDFISKVEEVIIEYDRK